MRARVMPQSGVPLAIASAAIVLLTPVTTRAGGGSAEWCERQWKAASANAAFAAPEAKAALLARWEGYRAKCAGTGVFEARLAGAHALVGQYDEARKVLKPLLGASRAHRELVELTALSVDYLELGAHEATTTVEDVRRLEGKLRALTAKYPAFPEGSALLGSVQTFLGNHADAVTSLEAALRSADMDRSGVYRNLTLSYVGVGRYADARRSADEALRRHPGFADDRWFVFAMARADGALGNFKAALDELNAISGKGDEVVRDPEFKETVDFVRTRWEEHKARGGPR